MSKSYIPAPRDSRRDTFDRRFMRGVDATTRWFQRHWLAVFNGSALALVIGGFLSPFAKAQGWDGLADALWRFYRNSGICASPNTYYVFGHSMCLCQRCTAIYMAMFLAGLGFAAMRRFLPPLNVKIFALMIIPMVIDGFTQLFGLRQSDWILRTITGSLFGFACVWFIYPRFAGINEAEIQKSGVQPAQFTPS